MAKLEKHGKGIVLMHDFQKRTAEALAGAARRSSRPAATRSCTCARRRRSRRIAEVRRDADQGAEAADRQPASDLERGARRRRVIPRDRSDLLSGSKDRRDAFPAVFFCMMRQCPPRTASKASRSCPPTACWRTPTASCRPSSHRSRSGVFSSRARSAAAVIHGRNSGEQQPRSAERAAAWSRRAALQTLTRDPSNPKALLWNPATTPFEDGPARARRDAAAGSASSAAPSCSGCSCRVTTSSICRARANVRLPGGRPVFPQVPARSPEDVLLGNTA